MYNVCNILLWTLSLNPKCYVIMPCLTVDDAVCSCTYVFQPLTSECGMLLMAE